MTLKKGEPWQDKFICSLAKCGNVSVSATAAGVSRQAAYQHRDVDENFKALWHDAIDCAGDLLEEEARRRAQDGVLKPVFQGGLKVGEIREYSDTLMIFLLKGAKPDKYKDRKEIAGPNNGPVVMKMQYDDLRKMDPADLARLHRETIGDPTENR